MCEIVCVLCVRACVKGADCNQHNNKTLLPCVHLKFYVCFLFQKSNNHKNTALIFFF